MAAPTSGLEARPVRLDDLVAERGAQPAWVLGGRDVVPGCPRSPGGSRHGPADLKLPLAIAVICRAATGGLGGGAQYGSPRSPNDVASRGARRCPGPNGSARARPRRRAVMSPYSGPRRVSCPSRLEGEEAAARTPGSAASRPGRCRARTAPCPKPPPPSEPPLDPLVERRVSLMGCGSGRTAPARRPEPSLTPGIRLAQDDQARPAQPEHELGIEGGHVAGQEAGTLR